MEKPLIHLRLQKYLMIAVGQWEFKQNGNFLMKMYSKLANFPLIFLTVNTHFLLATILIYGHCLRMVIDVVFYYVHFIVPIILTILMKSDKIQMALRTIMDYEKQSLNLEDDEAAKIYIKYSKLNNIITVFYIVIINMVAWIWYILGLKNSLNTASTEACPVTKGLLFQIWYPFDIEKYYWICLLYDRTTVFTAMMFFCYYKIVPMALIIFIIGQIKILQYYVRCIDMKASNFMKRAITNTDDAIYLTIKDCLRKHQEVIRIMNLVQSAAREIVLIQYFSYTLDTAAFMIPTLMEDSFQQQLRCFGAFAMAVIQMFLFFWYANEIQVESAGLSKIIYNETNWLDYGKRERKLLLLMMARSQKKLSLTAAAVGEMSIDSFTKIMRLCYSIVTFFTTVYDI